MCGINGFISNDKIHDFVNLYSSGMLLKSRGPERQSIYQTDNLFLMFHRLCILNTSNAGDAPFVHIHGNTSYFILCNGEIYNYKDLELIYKLPSYPNDTSYIYPIFKRIKDNSYTLQPIEIFKQLNNALIGNEYALAMIECVDNKPTNVYLSVDTSSVRPLFYYLDDTTGTYSFSSLLKGLTNINNINKKLIKRLPGGNMIHIDCKKQVSITSSYLEPLKINCIIPSYENILNIDIVKKIYTAVKIRCQSDREIGCLLSGGLDSSLVAALATIYLKKHRKKLKTFTIGMAGGSDLKYARQVAEYINSDHTEILFTKEEGLAVLEDVIKTTETYDITTIRASVGQYLIGKYISENTNVKVILNGDGADEIHLGYLYFHNLPSDEEGHLDSIRLIDDIHLYDGLRVDRCISHWGLESRLPFLDYNIVNFFKTLHPSIKKPRPSPGTSSPCMEKYFIRDSFDKYYSILTPNAILPFNILWRTKEAFSDGISNSEDSWYLIVQKYITEYKKGVDVSKEYKHLPPVSYESRWYRETFENLFGEDVTSIIPYYWLPRFVKSTEPSARTLDIYKQK